MKNKNFKNEIFKFIQEKTPNKLESVSDILDIKIKELKILMMMTDLSMNII